MPRVTFVERNGTRREVEAPLGLSLLEIAHNNGIDIEGRRRHAVTGAQRQLQPLQPACLRIQDLFAGHRRGSVRRAGRQGDLHSRA